MLEAVISRVKVCVSIHVIRPVNNYAMTIVHGPAHLVVVKDARILARRIAIEIAQVSPDRMDAEAVRIPVVLTVLVEAVEIFVVQTITVHVIITAD